MQLNNTLAPAATNTAGYAAGVTGAGPWVPSTLVSGDGLARNVTIKNNTANSHSGKTLTIVGLDANGKAQTETGLTGPGISATVTSAKFFSRVDSVTPNATIGADTFDIGWAQTWVSWDFTMNPEVDYLPVFQAVVTGTINFDLAGTLQNTPDLTYSAVSYANDANWTAKTASVAPTALALRYRKVRLECNSFTTGATIALYAAVPGM